MGCLKKIPCTRGLKLLDLYLDEKGLDYACLDIKDLHYTLVLTHVPLKIYSQVARHWIRNLAQENSWKISEDIGAEDDMVMVLLKIDVSNEETSDG